MKFYILFSVEKKNLQLKLELAQKELHEKDQKNEELAKQLNQLQKKLASIGLQTMALSGQQTKKTKKPYGKPDIKEDQRKPPKGNKVPQNKNYKKNE